MRFGRSIGGLMGLENGVWYKEETKQKRDANIRYCFAIRADDAELDYARLTPVSPLHTRES